MSHSALFSSAKLRAAAVHDAGQIKAVVYCGLLALGMAGCAVGRSEVDVSVLPAHATEPKETVTIIEIRDRRPFAVNPGDRSLPSLATEAEVNDPDLTARTLGRTRNAYGMRIGDVVLPEGQTVTDLVRSAVTTALREKGYVVVDEVSPGIVPLSVDIEQFWTWFEPGLFTVTLQFDSRLRIYGADLLDNTPTVVRGSASTNSAIAVKSTWAGVIQQGLDSLVLNIKDELEAAAAPRSLATTEAESNPAIP